MSVVPFRHALDRLFGDFFGEAAGAGGTGTGSVLAHFSPLTATAARCDLVEKPDHFEVTAELPGFKKEEVSLEVHHGVLTLKAEKSEAKEEDSEREGVKYHRMERSSGALYRQIKLPPGADTDRITAKSEQGVLSIVIGKKAAAAGGAGAQRVAVA